MHAHKLKKHDIEPPTAKGELYKVSSLGTVEAKALGFMQRQFKIELTKAGLQACSYYPLAQVIMPAINAEIDKLRDKPYLAQLSLDSASLDYPISTGLHKINELDVNELFERAERTDMSEKIVSLNDKNPFVRFMLFVKTIE